MWSLLPTFWTATEINTHILYTKKKITKNFNWFVWRASKKIKSDFWSSTSSIFLYEISVVDYFNKCQFTIAHMLSERHDSNSISHWLTEWSKNSIVSPKLVVTDQSLALMMTVMKAFTQYTTFSKPISVCLSLILKESTELPTCMLWNDFNHIMRILSTWTEIKSCTFRSKNFYLKSIASDFEYRWNYWY